MQYISPADHGCSKCRDLSGWTGQGNREIPRQLEPAETAIADSGGWSRYFHRCRDCQAWWAVSWDPKDMCYWLTAAHRSIEKALRASASLDQAWPFLFAPAPIDEMFEPFLYEGRICAQDALDRLLKTFRNPRATPANQSDILRMIGRLLSLRNPIHAELRDQQGWVWETPRKDQFARPILEFERRFQSADPHFRACATYGPNDMKTLRWVLERDANGQRRIFRQSTPEL